jgi:AraC-like DNA-binding protein
MRIKDFLNLVIQYVVSVPDEEFAELSVSRLATHFKISRYKLSRQFKREKKMTVEEFLFREKMTRAAVMLTTEEGIRVKDVPDRIGFCTSDYFIRKFREYYGIVPGKYKEFKTRGQDSEVRKNENTHKSH